MKIFGIDPALASTGWAVLEVPENCPVPSSPAPDWLQAKLKKPGLHNHSDYNILASGTIYQKDTKVPNLIRCGNTQRQILAMIDVHQPDLIAIEAQLSEGESRFVAGVVVQSLILNPFLPQFCIHPSVKHVMTFHPIRLQGAAHGERSTEPSVVTQRVHQLWPGGRISVHAADAILLAYHLHRFYRVEVSKDMPVTVLSEKEKHYFYHPKDGMVAKGRQVWWPTRDTSLTVTGTSPPQT